MGAGAGIEFGAEPELADVGVVGLVMLSSEKEKEEERGQVVRVSRVRDFDGQARRISDNHVPMQELVLVNEATILKGNGTKATLPPGEDEDAEAEAEEEGKKCKSDKEMKPRRADAVMPVRITNCGKADLSSLLSCPKAVWRVQVPITNAWLGCGCG
jgi:hypothetical protein